MSETTAANAAFIQSEIQSILVQPLEAASIVLAAGPKVIDSAAPIRIPVISGGPSGVGYVAEGEAIPLGDITTTQITAMPTTLAGVKDIVKVTEELIRASTVEVSQVFQQRVALVVASKVDTELLLGDGTTGHVRGLFNTTGAATSELDVTDIDSLLTAIDVAYANEIKPTHWFVNGSDFIKLRKLKDTTGRYLIESDVTQDVTYRLHGVPVIASNKVPAGKALLVDMGQVIVVRDIAPSIQILTELYAGTGEVGIKVQARYDLTVTHPQAVTVLTATP